MNTDEHRFGIGTRTRIGEGRTAVRRALRWMLCALTAGSCTAFEPPALAPPGTSVGGTDEGWLVDGIQLPAEAEGLQAYRAADTRYGTGRLREVVVETAAYLSARFGDTVLWVGDASPRAGGKVSGHHSHRSGRDVDLLFFARAADGSAGRRARFFKFGADGLAVGVSPPVSLDLERNWALVRHLLEAYPADVQWIFVSTGVKTALLAYALAAGAPLDLVDRALSVLHQPSDSTPHDDHFHVRLYCAPEDRASGCVDVPPIWPWVRRTYDRTPHAVVDDAVLLELALGPL